MCKHYTIFCKRLEHLKILVSSGGPGINPPQVPRNNCTVPWALSSSGSHHGPVYYTHFIDEDTEALYPLLCCCHSAHFNHDSMHQKFLAQLLLQFGSGILLPEWAFGFPYIEIFSLCLRQFHTLSKEWGSLGILVRAGRYLAKGLAEGSVASLPLGRPSSPHHSFHLLTQETALITVRFM